MLMVDSQGDNIRVSRGGEWCYNISTPEYPRVAGAQLINHFVSGGVRYHIHIHRTEGYRGGRREAARAGVDHPDAHRIYHRLPFTDRGRINGNNRHARRMGQLRHTTTISALMIWVFRSDGADHPRASSSRNGGENYKCLIFCLVWPGLFNCFSNCNWECQRRWNISFFLNLIYIYLYMHPLIAMLWVWNIF